MNKMYIYSIPWHHNSLLKHNYCDDMAQWSIKRHKSSAAEVVSRFQEIAHLLSAQLSLGFPELTNGVKDSNEDICGDSPAKWIREKFPDWIKVLGKFPG